MNLINLPAKRILPILSAASFLRKDKIFISFLIIAKEKRINKTKIYEALLQTYLFAGFPSALISLEKFSKIFRIKFYTKENKSSKDFRKRGEENCKKIYENKYEKLISNVNSFSPELADWLIVEGYGKVLGRKGLSFKERELCIISILSSLMFKSQLHSHINGALKIGIKQEEIIQIISDLQFLGSKKYTKFGNKILKEVIKNK